MNVLLLGLGRMGQRYVTTLQKLYKKDLNLVVVDPHSKNLGNLQLLSSVSEINSMQTFDLAIDARPNRDRLRTLEKLIEFNIPRIIIEKPHASSLLESKTMAELIKNFPQTKVMIPFYRRYSEMFNPTIFRDFGAGELLQINVTAGAIGLGCNGVHLLDAANTLFADHPITVYGSLNLDSIESPRGPEFFDHAGILIIEYPRKRKLTLNILNDSSTGATTCYYLEHGKVIMSENRNPNWKWYKRSQDNINLPNYRTHMDEEVPAPFEYNLNLFNMMEKGIKNFMETPDSAPNLEDAHLVLETIALSIVSSDSGQKQKWPISEGNSKVKEIKFQFT